MGEINKMDENKLAKKRLAFEKRLHKIIEKNKYLIKDYKLELEWN